MITPTTTRKIRKAVLCVLLTVLLDGCASVRVVRQDTRFKGGYLRLYGLCLNDAWYVKWPGEIGAYTTAKFDDPKCARQDNEIRHAVPKISKKIFIYRRTTFTILRVNEYASIEVQQSNGSFQQDHVLVKNYDAFTGTFETDSSIFKLK